MSPVHRVEPTPVAPEANYSIRTGKPKTIGLPNPKSLHTLATAVQVFAVLYGIGSVIAGIATCTVSGTGTDAFGNDITTHPYVGIGLALIFGGLFSALVVSMLAEWAKLHAQMAAADFTVV